MKSATKRYSGLFLKCIQGWLAALLVLAGGSVAFSGMHTLGDKDLGAITGQSGVSIYVDINTLVTIDSLKIYDSGEVNSFEFRNLTIDKDGTGAYFRIYTPLYFDTVTPQIVGTPIEFDIGTNDTGRTAVRLFDPSHMAPRTYTVDRFFFCDQELGYADDSNPATWSIRLAGLEHMQPAVTHFAAHADGSVGIDFDYGTQLYASSLKYNYNDAGGALSFANIHLARAANGGSDNPADPGTWSFTGDNLFQIGNIFNNSPATIDVGTNKTDPDDTALFLNLPMSGSLRIGKVEFGGNDFGPIAIDGINVHHLFVKISTK